MRAISFALTFLAATACSKREGGPGPRPDAGARVARRHADLAYESYRAAGEGARRLQAAIDQLAAAPAAATLAGAREAWRAARVPYTRTEAFRFYGGPIDE